MMSILQTKYLHIQVYINRFPGLNFVTTNPCGNYFRKYKTQFVWLNIFQNNQFSFSYKCKFCWKKKYLHENNMIYIIKNESLYQNKVNSIFDCNCRIGYYCFPFSFRCRCSVCLYYELHLHALNNQQKRWLSLVYVSGIGRSLSRYMHHSVIQRQYSQKFTTWQEREKLTLSLYKT